MSPRATTAMRSLVAWGTRWLPRRLEFQLLWMTSVCLVLSIMGYGAYRAQAELTESRHSVTERMTALAKNTATISEHFLQTNERHNIEPLILQLATVDGIYSVVVTELDGTPVTEVVNKNLVWSPRYGAEQMAVPERSGPASVLEIKSHNPNKRDFLAGTAGTMTAWQRIGTDFPQGWVMVNYRLDTFDALAASIYWQAAKAVTLAILITVALLSLLLRPSMRALREATEFASRMDTAMGSHLRVSRRAAEVEALGNALNVMSDRLLMQHTELSNQKSALDEHAIVSITDLDGNIIYANQRFCDISGYDALELLGQNHRIVKSNEHTAAFFEGMWLTISQGRVWHGEIKNRKKNGDFYWVSATVVPLLGRDGLPYRYIGIRTDITSNKLLEEKLQQAKEDAETAARTKAQFLANMSHEIRTPMNAILGMLRLLQNTDLNKRQLDYASKAEGAAQSLLGLLNDILDFSKIDAGKMTLEARPFRLDKLMRDLSVIVSANLGVKPVEVLFDIDPQLPRALTGDALRLQQVLINLASNAVKFTHQGEVVVRITQLARTDGDVTMRFAVKDSGIGIAPENQQHIFTGFSQAEASTTRRFGGTGLGLSISKKLVGLMGGELSLQSMLGHGSTFSFEVTLPWSPEPVALPDLRDPTPNAVDLRVLVVDDNAMAREVLQSMAESLGWHVDVACDGPSALALVNARRESGQPPFDAMFVDWQMPGLDGWQTIDALQAVPGQSRLPIVVMVTANGREMLTQRSPQEQSRLHGFLVKPVTASMLLDAVADALASRKQPAQAPVASAQSTPLQGLRLLVVEDNIINQQVAQEMLSHQGAEIVLADNGQLGVDAVLQALKDSKPFDAVLMDIQMPVMDGYTATRLLRQELGLTTLPIIAMTANAMASDREACLAAGMNDHVGKPFNLLHLVNLLQSLTQPVAPEAAQDMPQVSAVALASSTPVAPTLPPKDEVDLAGALERLGGNQALYARVLQSYLDDLAGQPDQLEAQLTSRDLVGAVRLLHTLKGLSATVGASYMAAVARKAELLVKTAQDAAPGSSRLDVASLCFEVRAAALNTQRVLGVVSKEFAAPAFAKSMVGAAGQLNETQISQLRQLKALLKASDMQAFLLFEALQTTDAFTHMDGYLSLSQAMANFDFVAAAQVCARLLPADTPAQPDGLGQALS